MAGEQGEKHRKTTRRTGKRCKQPELVVTLDIKEVQFTPERLEKFRRQLAALVAPTVEKIKASDVTEAKGEGKEENNPEAQG